MLGATVRSGFGRPKVLTVADRVGPSQHVGLTLYAHICRPFLLPIPEGASMLSVYGMDTPRVIRKGRPWRRRSRLGPGADLSAKAEGGRRYR